MITNSFDESKPITNLESIYGEQKHLIDKCLVIFSKSIYDYLLETFDCKKISFVGACNGNKPIYAFDYKGEKIGFFLTMIGSMGTSQMVIETNWQAGATKFVMFGSCGSLDKEKTQNKYIVPTEAYRDEGMSYHYAAPSDYITLKNADKVAKVFDELHVPYVLGKTWTTDAFLRETVSQCNQRKSEGCLAVEMEVAGVEAVCQFHGLDLYDFLQPGDVLLGDNYSIANLKNANHDLDKLFIALALALKI